MTIQVLYLDTHVLVWLYAFGIHGVSDRAAEQLEAAQSLVISPMVLLETEYLYETEKIRYPSSVMSHYLFEHIALTVCSKPFQRVAAKALEMKWTRDPFDRLITAQASLDQDFLVTKDRTIHDHYQQAIW